MNTSLAPARDHTITEAIAVATAEKEALLASTQEFSVAEARATKALLAAGVANAGLFVRQAMQMAQQPIYEPHEQTSRVLAALGTLIALHTRKWPRLGEGQRPAPLLISLARLATDIVHAVQIRVNGIDPNIVDDYVRAMEAGDEFPPVVVFWNKSTNHVFVADGFHRYEAALCVADRYMIPAEVYAGTQLDAMEYAATCNATHGIPMTSADKRAAVGRLLTMHPDWSDRAIARKVGCSPTTIGTVRKEHGLSVQNGQIEPERTVTRGDSTYKFTPPDRERQEKPTYAKIWELERYVYHHLDGLYGTERTVSTLALRIERLAALKDTHAMLVTTLTPPAPYLMGDLIQAVNNVLDQNRQSQARLQQSEDSEEPAQAPDEQRTPILPPPVIPSAAARVVNFPRTTQDPLTLEPWQYMKRMMIDGNHQELRLALMHGKEADFYNALYEIFLPPVGDRGVRAAQTLFNAIVIPGLQTEPEYAPPAAEASDDLACPGCGGDVELKESNGDYILVCSDCGSIMEPAI